MVRKKQNLESQLPISSVIIFYKFFLGIIELILGIGIIFLGNQIMVTYEHFKTQELLEDPHDLLVSTIEKLLPYILEHQVYIILTLIALGLAKVIGALALLYRKHWGLDLLIGLTFILLPFEFYNLVLHPSFYKLGYFVVNILITLYLVKFKPKDYFSNLKKRIFLPTNS